MRIDLSPLWDNVFTNGIFAVLAELFSVFLDDILIGSFQYVADFIWSLSANTVLFLGIILFIAIMLIRTLARTPQ